MTAASAADERESDVVLADISLSRSATVQLVVVGSIGLLVAFGAFGALYEVGTGEPMTFAFGPQVDWWNGALNVVAFAFLSTVIVVPHEYLHGLAIRAFGGEVSYGVGLAHFVLPYAYATTEQEFSRNQFVVVALAPLVVLTLLGVPAMIAFEWPWLVVPLAANAAGAVGDVWMTLVVLGYPSHVRIADSKTGMRIVGRAGDESPGLSVTHLAWDALVGATGAMILAFLLVGLFGPLVLSSLGVESITVGTPGTFTYLFDYTETPDSVSFGVGLGWLVVGGAVGLAYGLVRSYLRHRHGADSAN